MTWRERKFIAKLFKLEDDPIKIAQGFALGSFIGMLPLPGFQWLLAIPIAYFLHWNKKAAFIAVFNTNVFTGAFIFAFNFWVGKMILGLSPQFYFPDKVGITFIKQIFDAGFDVFLCMTIGGIAVGIPVAIISYYLVKLILQADKSRNINLLNEK